VMPAVAVMTRAPSAPGKSRLIRDLETSDGEGLRRALLQDTFDVVSALDAAKTILYTPKDREAEVAALAPFPAALVAQRGDTLGERMNNGACDLARLGSDAVILIGSDLPTLPSAHVSAAVHAVQRRDVLVLGPAADGGYYLIGGRELPSPLFNRIPWGTAAVLERTAEAAAALGLAVELIPQWYDIDVSADLRRAVADAGRSRGTARHTLAWLAGAPPDVRARVDGARMHERGVT
jgi:rSAM/selenodomain-associated transferase 1